MKNQELIKEVTEKAKQWLSPVFDEETRAEVQKMLDNEDKTDLIESFYKSLEFGTGGLRGIMGVGSNRMNKYTLGMATQGLSNYLNQQFKDLDQISVVVGHDCRNNSRKFAEITADIFSANGIKVYLFEDLRPTPEISFAIRHLGCQSGVMITASHNPKEYNGYKAYWDDGAQVLAPHDVGIINEVNKMSPKEVKFNGDESLIEILGEEMDNIFLQAGKAISINPEIIKRHHDIKLVYTPIHGTGVKIVPAALRLWGFTNIINVPEQDVVSGNFPTVESPNPEEPAALSMAIERAKATDAELVMASDPDGDRIGIACKNEKGEWVLVNGNQLCLLFLYYILTQYQSKKLLKGNEFCVKTIVTTELIKEIAERNGIAMLDTYTGFKWIAKEIRQREGKEKYIGGGEESYGFLPGDYVRDKDSVTSCCLVAEIAAWAKDNGLSLYQVLEDIYVEYGFSKEKGISVVKTGKSGADEIRRMMTDFRNNPPKEIAGSKVVLWKDYQSLKAKDGEGNETDIIMPDTSNVLQYFTEAGDKISIRPSGTEPKIKFYIEVKGEMKGRDDYEKANSEADAKIEQAKKDLGIN
ncbi:MAG: phospho-sugar mutase [Bacteroidales bacterium]|mgnify:CR=1 FL=1|nr:phospho-sugar mutase [Bacteroidales bacterium]